MDQEILDNIDNFMREADPADVFSISDKDAFGIEDLEFDDSSDGDAFGVDGGYDF